MIDLTLLQWVAGGIGGIILLYIVTRLVSSAVFRSYFEQKKRSEH
jgi:hypothetical protein